MFRFNYGNVVVGTCFDEWVESIYAEFNRVLSIDRDSSFADVAIKLSNWGKDKSGKLIKARLIYSSSMPHIFSLSFAEKEYEQLKEDKKRLSTLLAMRLIDLLWSIEDHREELFKVLQQFDPEHKTTDDWIH